MCVKRRERGAPVAGQREEVDLRDLRVAEQLVHAAGAARVRGQRELREAHLERADEVVGADELRVPALQHEHARLCDLLVVTRAEQRLRVLHAQLVLRAHVVELEHEAPVEHAGAVHTAANSRTGQ